jgi:cytochrome c556
MGVYLGTISKDTVPYDNDMTRSELYTLSSSSHVPFAFTLSTSDPNTLDSFHAGPCICAAYPQSTQRLQRPGKIAAHVSRSLW